MSDQVEKFDPSKLMDGVKDRIKATFISLIPDDAWNKMVKDEVDRFFAPNQSWNYNGNRDKMSPFQLLVQTELTAEMTKKLRLYLDGPEFAVIYDSYGQPVASKAVQDMIVENAGAVLSSMYSGMAASMIRNFRDSLNIR